MQKKLTRFILLIGAAILLISALVVGPSLRYIIELQNRISTTEEILETYYQKTRQAQQSIRNLDAAALETDAYRQSSLSKDDELAFITRLESLAEEHGIIQELSARLVEPASAAVRPYYEFSFSNTGSFENHLRHLWALERLPQYVNIKSMEWRRGAQGGANATVLLSFQAIVYATLSRE